MQPLDKFGQFVVEHLRDDPLRYFDKLVAGEWKAPALKELQAKLGKLTAAQTKPVRECVESVLTNQLHDFLFAVVEANNRNQGLTITMDGENVVEASDGLHGEPFTDEGWIARFSAFPES